MSENILQYNTYSSFINPGFWHKFAQLKLDVDKLDGQRKKIWGSYRSDMGNLLEVDGTAFNSVPDVQKRCGIAHGVLLNKNTIEEFKSCSVSDLINEEGKLVLNDMKSDACVENPTLLSRFIILSFGDFKKFQYYYWFAYPVPSYPVVYTTLKPRCIVDVFNSEQIKTFQESYESLDTMQKTFFCLKVMENEITTITISETVNLIENSDICSLDKSLYFGFLDSSTDVNPCWFLRNYIFFLMHKCQKICGKSANFVALRFERNNNISKSMIYSVAIPENKCEYGEKWIGWERNDKESFGPRFINMASSMDPAILAESSVDLNLKLMKWRLLPDLDLDKLKNLKCLLLGAGTLGCAVSRNLLAWGVKNISFVDNGKVSYSNPVRQNLFTYKDCLNGGKPKATAAANNLKDIYPGVISNGFAIHIPMPGHPVGESLKETTEKDVNTLTKLISEHDVIFLLLDSREARWLPTVIASYYKKIVINAALGFDSYLIMRHGIAREIEDTTKNATNSNLNELRQNIIPGTELGCYFCNDVTSPGNSQKDRTLDQQCTVTRPGVANIAGALASEIAIAVVQHKLNINAPAPYNFNGEFEDNQSMLGIIPHSIRGFLINYQQVLPSTAKFKQCIACSESVVSKYKTHGIEFLMQVFNNAKYLEDVTGLTNLQVEADNAEIWALSDED